MHFKLEISKKYVRVAKKLPSTILLFFCKYIFCLPRFSVGFSCVFTALPDFALRFSRSCRVVRFCTDFSGVFDGCSNFSAMCVAFFAGCPYFASRYLSFSIQSDFAILR